MKRSVHLFDNLSLFVSCFDNLSLFRFSFPKRILLGLLIFTIPVSIHAAVIHVPADASTIANAVDIAQNGDTVLVADGVYSGYGNRNIYLEGKAITIASENGPEFCTIDIQASAADNHRAFNFVDNETSDTILSGFTIINGYTGHSMASSHGGAILCDAASPVIENCIFSNNHAYFSGGAIESYEGDITIRSCVFSNNTVSFLGGAVYVHGSGTIENCLFDGNIALGISGLHGHAGAIHCSFDAIRIIVDDCTFNNNHADYGGAISASSGNTSITRCQFTGNDAHLGGAICAGDSQMVIGGTETTGNTFNGNRAVCGAELFIDGGTDVVNAQFNTFEGNPGSEYWIYNPDQFDLTGSTFALELMTDDVYVAPDGDDSNDGLSWETPFRTVHHAMSRIYATEIDPVNVFLAPGTYSPSATGELFPIPGHNWTIIQGSGQNETILDAEHTNLGVLIYYQSMKLIDLTVRNGDHMYGGILCRESSPVLERCSVIDCIGSETGGITCYSHSSATILDCDISGNTGYEGGGIRCFNESNATIVNCNIANNVSSHSGGGIRADYYSLPVIFGCHISGNTSEYGGGVYCYKSNIQIINSLIAMNSAQIGGGALASQCGAVMQNCTVYGNAASSGAGFAGDNLVSEITDCIFWANRPDQISGEGVVVTWSDVQGGFPGEGNFDEDPMFVTGTDGYFYLSNTAAGQMQDSPCIDTGSDLAENICVDLSSGMECMDEYWTRTDGVADEGQVDPGYHYPLGGESVLCLNNGDVTREGQVTSGDAQLAFMIALGLYSPAYTEECAADCNGNSEITAEDGQLIFMKAMGMGACEDDGN